MSYLLKNVRSIKMPIPDAYPHEIEAMNKWTKKCERARFWENVRIFALPVMIVLLYVELFIYMAVR